MHERRRLDDRQPGVEQPGDQLRLDLGRDQRGLVLQAVAGADLVDRDALGQPVEGDDGGALHQASFSTTNSRWPSDTWSPTAAATVGDGAREGRLEGQLHLHRLDHAEHVALGDGVARGHPHVEHGAGHRRDHRPVAGGRSVVGEDVGPLEDEPLAPVGDLRGVRLDVDDGDLAPAVDAEHRDVVLGRQLPDLVAASPTVPAARSTSSVSSSSTTVGDGVPPRRQPSDWNGCPVSWTATSSAWIHAAKTRGTSRARRLHDRGVEPGGVDGGEPELLARDQRAQEPGVGGEPEDARRVERLDQRTPGRLAVGAVGDHLAEHRVVRRADDLAARQRLVDPDTPVGQRTRSAVPACGRNPPNESSA